VFHCYPVVSYCMEFTLKFDHGPLQAEVTGEEREEVKEEFLEFATFFEDHEQEIEAIIDQTIEGTVQTPATGWQEAEPSEETDKRLFLLAERTHVEISVLEELIDIPEDEDEVPHLRLYNLEEGEEALGSSRRERQARGSLILVYIWQECLDHHEVESEELNTALSYSDIDPQRRDAMYNALGGDAGNYFDRNGVIGLTPPGEHHARIEIQSLAEIFDSEQDDL